LKILLALHESTVAAIDRLMPVSVNSACGSEGPHPLHSSPTGFRNAFKAFVRSIGQSTLESIDCA
jgi:hypothetical protein